MSLQDLPPELTERVVVLLSLRDISSLRLTNKCLAIKTAQKHLKARFRTKRVELTEQRFRSFVAITAYGGLVCLLQDLTLVAPAYNTLELTARLKTKEAGAAKLDDEGRYIGHGRRDLTDEDLRQTELDLAVLQEKHAEQLDLQRRQKDVELLGLALSNLAAHGASLRVLRTEVEVYMDDTTTPLLPIFGGHEKPIWDASAHVSRTLFASLAACDLPIQTLDLFGDSRMIRCSLPCDELNGVDFASVRLGSSLGHLTGLSLRVSDRHVRDHTNRGIPEETTQENFDGLRSLLRTCSSIQKLDLAHFSRVFVRREHKQHVRLLRVLGESSLRHLRCLTLQGLELSERELLTSLQGFGTLRSLSLRYICLTDGSFTPIFDYCTLEAAMERLELDSLSHRVNLGGSFESRTLMFESPWVVQASVPALGNLRPAQFPDSRASYRRSSDNITDQRIKHHFHPRTLDAAYIRTWNQDMKNRIGPLSERGAPSVLQPYIRPGITWRFR